jgi:hypothetical protein
MVARTALIAGSLFGIIFLLLGTTITIATQRGYGLELRMLGICALAGTAAVILLGVWLFLRAR